MAIASPHRIYDRPQETMTDIRRALRMYEILSQWDQDRQTRKKTIDQTKPM